MSLISMTINADTPAEFRSILTALLGSAAPAAVAAPMPGNVSAKPATDKPTATSETAASESPASAGTGETAPTAASPSDDGAIDAHGHPWSADMHASTKGVTKEGLWRMKIGVTRPAPLPGFPNDAGVVAAAAASPTPTSSSAPVAGAETATAAGISSTAADDDDDDEFAAFHAAAAASDAAEATAAENVPARKWTDADLSGLCNQAAGKLGDPAPIKELITEFVKTGEVPHSRNIDEADREAFAQALEAKAGITFAG